MACFFALAACSDRDTALAPHDDLIAAVDQRLAAWGTAIDIDPLRTSQVNTTALEGCPHESVDGQSLFFASDRSGNIDIWVAHRGPDGSWGVPEALPAPVNSSANDFCPTPLPGGGLLFVSTRADGQNCGSGTADIYETQSIQNGGWTSPANLGCTVNSAGNEFSPSLVHAGGGMLFFSSDRAGKHQLYVSLQERGSWSAPAAITELNYVGFNSARPNVSQDGMEIVFDSDRPLGSGGFDIWYSQRATPRGEWLPPINLGAGVNSVASETRASFTRNRGQLYFGSTRAGSSDIYTAYR